MAKLPCDICGKLTNTNGSWDTEITIVCESCYKKTEAGEQKHISVTTDIIGMLNINKRIFKNDKK